MRPFRPGVHSALWVGLAGLASILHLLPQIAPSSASGATAGAPGFTVSTPLTWAGLVGLTSQGGTIGINPGEASGFNLGEYIIVNESLVIRATSEVENEPPLGSLDGNVAGLFSDPVKPGLGVGSLADVGNPGSEQISGGGKHGSEIVHFNSYGDPLVTTPRMIDPTSVIVELAEYYPPDDSVSLVLYHVNGTKWRTFEPAVVEPLLTWIGSESYLLNFADLPGISDLEALGSFDVRSGWFDPMAIGNGKGFKLGNGKGKGKGKVCHNGKTIKKLSQSAVAFHLAHGDTFGKCGGGNKGGLNGGEFWVSYVEFAAGDRIPLPSEAWD